MKLSCWLSGFCSRRSAIRPTLMAEILEPRALMDATLPELLEETGEMEDSSEEYGENPELIYFSLGGAASSSPVSQFGSREELGEYLLERALARYDGLFGEPAWWYRGPVYFRGGAFSAEAATPNFLDHSETNVQVEGIDEGDLIENDGKHLYLLNGNELVIMQAHPASEMRELSRVQFDGYAIAEYLDGNRLTVISQEYSYGGGIYGDFFAGASLRFAGPSSVTTVVSVFDVTNRSKPSLEKQTTLDGAYVDSRAFNGQVHVITSNDLALPAPETAGMTTIEVPIYYFGPPVYFDDVLSGDSLSIQETDEETEDGATDEAELKTERIEVPVYETREAYIARVRANLDSLIDDALPHYESLTANGLGATGFISEITAISRVNDSESDSLLSVVSIDTRSSQPGLVSSSSVISDWSNGIHASRDHLYVFSPVYGEDGAQTRILQFSWANGEREIQLLASGVVDGTLLNQYSADEFDGRLRIATTTSSFDEATGEFSQANHLTILENIDGILTEVGAVNGFAPDEQIYSVRFDGDRAFIVTFRQVDPLFAFDLSDPTAPAISGELHVPGFSSYLQVIDENFLLAVGRSTESQSTKVTLYNISDPANPFEVDEDILPRWTWSQAEWDAKAIGWFASHSTLAIPTSGFDEFGYHNELVVFRIDVTQSGESAIVQTGAVGDDGFISRSAFIGNVLYTISNNSVIASSIADPNTILGQVDFEFTPYWARLNIDPVFVEFDDGASDWEILELPDSLDDAEGMLALASVNVLDGTLRVSLLDADNTVNVTLQKNTLTLKAKGHHTQTISLDSAASLLIVGTADADRLNLTLRSSASSSLAAIVINAGDGNDRVQILAMDPSLAGIVTINGEAGNDRINIANSVRAGVQVNGGDGSDSLTGGSGNDTLDGGDGDDSLSGSNGDDLVIGGDGADLLYGRAGNDTLSGGVGRDRLFGGTGSDAIAGGEGNDVLFGESGQDTLLGGNGNDKLDGGSGNDVALGEDGDDTVSGGPGSQDSLSGGSGTNQIIGRRQEIHEAFTFQANWLDLI